MVVGARPLVDDLHAARLDDAEVRALCDEAVEAETGGGLELADLGPRQPLHPHKAVAPPPDLGGGSLA